MTKAQRRKAMPEVTAWIDAMREHFPGLKIQHASENGHEWGEPARVVELESGSYVHSNGTVTQGVGFMRVEAI